MARRVTEKQLANLRPVKTLTKERAKMIGSLGGKKAHENIKKKKMLSQIYADFLINSHFVKLGKKETELTPEEIVFKGVIKAILSGSSATGTILKEIADRTEGPSSAGGDATRDALNHFDALKLGLQNKTTKDGEE
jgi:hypothetical protein